MLALILGLSAALAGVLQVDVFDIGQGDAILLQSPEGKTVLIDAGTGRVPLQPLLSARGVSQLDLVIATHPHADHIGGFNDILSTYPVGRYLDSGQTHTTATYTELMTLIERNGVAYQTAEVGDRFNLGAEVQIDILHPQRSMLSGTRSDLNSNSVVARVTHGNSCFLFTGDAEDSTEHALLRAGLGECDVLKVAHHGGAHSTSRGWLQRVQPQVALISAGQGNRYKHPRQETLDRLESAGTAIYRTDTMGSIHLESDGETITVSAERHPTADTFTATPPRPSEPPPQPVATAPTVPEPTAAAPATVPATADAESPGRLNINTADKTTMASLLGGDEALAIEVIRYRNAHGPFAAVEDLSVIKGISRRQARSLRTLATTEASSRPLPAPEPAPASAPRPATVPITGLPGGLNINSASPAELDTLPGIGPAKASAIIEYRNAHGPFTDINQLDNVPGIGPATMSDLRPRVTIGDSAGAPQATSARASSDQVDINSANQSQLETLPGIGPAKAAAIIAYRDANGVFESCDELVNVSGIGPATLNSLRASCATIIP